jgi:DeoR/GlpR family transcriptional regulator of sugar metabolism
MKTLRSLEIFNYIKDQQRCSISELMEHFNVSQATIHRDVTELAQRKIIYKVHGGVAIASAVPKEAEPVNSHFSERINKNLAKKMVIAEKAAKYIKHGDIIFLDSSTTVYQLARKLQKMQLSNLTIITNSILIIQEFHLFPPHFFLISVGGNFNCHLNSFLGKTAVENLKRLKINKAFFSAVGINKIGVSTFHEAHAEFLKEVLTLAEENYLTIDSSKFNKAGIFEICLNSQIDHVISDIELVSSISKSIKKTKILQEENLIKKQNRRTKDTVLV